LEDISNYVKQGLSCTVLSYKPCWPGWTHDTIHIDKGVQ